MDLNVQIKPLVFLRRKREKSMQKIDALKVNGWDFSKNLYKEKFNFEQTSNNWSSINSLWKT